jgi:predicted glycosyltransferase
VARQLEAHGHEVVVTARDHAQTLDLARDQFDEVTLIGGPSPAGRAAKIRSLARRVAALRSFAATRRPDVALSHGSYAQVVAAWLARVPSITMMDYEHQPANHLSFRLADAVVTPRAFPAAARRRFGARKVIVYDGFKEELYLAGFVPDPTVLDLLGLDEARVIAVFRPPPEGALYHRGGNDRFEELLEEALAHADVQVVVLPRTPEQRQRYEAAGATIPQRPIDGSSLLALADVVVGAGGTMSREAALLGVPTHTVFAGRLAAVDAALIARGRLHDLRAGGAGPEWVKRPKDAVGVDARRARVVSSAVEAAIREVTTAGTRAASRPVGVRS